MRQHRTLLACTILLLAGALAAGALAWPALDAQVPSAQAGLSAAANPSTVAAGQRVTYTVRLDNGSTAPLTGASLRHTLPAGFDLVPGSTRIRANGVAVPAGDPAMAGQVLTWQGLIVPTGRTDSVVGMHTFLQNGCDREVCSVGYQLDRVRDLMGPGAYVKQLVHHIDVNTSGPDARWLEFVKGAYGRNLIPVVRLQGEYRGDEYRDGVLIKAHWARPTPDASGGYTAIAQAYARVVKGLASVPERAGRPFYVEVWNEPNLDLEWGWAANPAEYARFLVDVSAAIRALGDGGIRVLNGGLSPGGDVRPQDFIDGMATVPGALDAFDVWATHPYPGNRPPEANLHDGTARLLPHLAIDSYALELDRLAFHGRRGLQVLLTETGYALGAHNLLDLLGYPEIGEANRADYMVRALRDYWSRWPEVLGVCPYQLVDHSGDWQVWDWLTPDGGHHQQYDAVAALDKTFPPAPGQLIVQFQAVANAAAGVYGSRVEVLAGGASTVLASAAPVEVQGALPSPTPSPTPAPGLVYYEVLQNGGFESDTCWEIPFTAYSATYTSRRVASGSRAMQVGQVDGDPLRAYSSVRQPFTVPANAVSVRIRYAYYAVSGDLARGRQFVLLQDGAGQTVEFLRVTPEDRARWETAVHEVSGHAGETLWLYFGVYNPDNAEGVTAMFVDDVHVEVGLPEGDPAPPPLAPCPCLARAQFLPLVYSSRLDATAGAAALAEASAAVGATPASAVSDLASGELVVAEMGDLAPLGEPLGGEGAPGRPTLAYDAARGRLLLGWGAQVTARDAATGQTLFQAALPGAVATLTVDQDSGWLWASLADEGTVLAVDAAGQIAARAEGLGRPTGLALGDGVVYVADSARNRLAVLDAASGAPLRLEDLPAAPYALARDAASRRVFVGLVGEGSVLALREDTLEPVGEVVLGGLGLPTQLVVDPTAGRLYAVYALSPKFGALAAIDTQTMRLVVVRSGDYGEPLQGARQVLLPAAGEDLLLATSRGLVALGRGDLTLRGTARAALGPASYALDARRGAIYAATGSGRLLAWRAEGFLAGLETGGGAR